jgi:hypothetical protein
MTNEADRVLRERAESAARREATETAHSEEQVRAVQRQLMEDIALAVPQTLARLADAGFPGGKILSIAKPLGRGPFASSKVKYVDKASWPLVTVSLPGKDSPDTEAFDLVSDGYVLGPYRTELSQREIDRNWRLKRGRGAGPDGSLHPWPLPHDPHTLGQVLAALKALHCAD